MTNRKLFSVIIGLSMISLAYADQSISDWPLASQTTGSYPNVLFLVDDSGSMGTNSDVFYAPSYDGDNIYQCSSGTLLSAVAGQILQINVVNDYSGGGKPYFIYNGTKYGWGPTGTAKDENDVVLNRACFSVTADYAVKFKDYSATTTTCKSGFSLATDGNCYQAVNQITVPAYCDASDALATQVSDGKSYCWATVRDKKDQSRVCNNNNNWGSNYTEINYKLTTYAVTCGRTGTYRTNPYTLGCAIGYSSITIGAAAKCGLDISLYKPNVLLTPNSSLAAETQSGNFLNWYLSKTEARYSSANLLPGYAGYTAAGVLTTNDTGLPWTQIPADNFAIANSTSGYGSYLGNKLLVHWNHQRMAVADDIGKVLTRKIKDVRLALGSFWTDGKGDKKSSEGWLLHEFADLSVAAGDATDPLVIASKLRSDSNRKTLIKQWEKINAGSGTPTAGSIVRMARYFFQGWESEIFAYFNKVDAALAPAPQTTARSVTAKKIQDVLTLAPQSMANTQKAYENSSVNTSKILTKDHWCEKNAMAVLTDGQPSSDTAWAGTGPMATYDTYGTNKENYSTDLDYKGIIRAPGALFDHDWIPSMRDTQNIETFFIAFGSPSVINDVVFNYAGLAGGGGVKNSYPATSGAAVLDAFKSIIQRVSSANFGISAVAVSSPATLQTTNYVFQSTYNTEFYTGNLFAYNLNKDGLFTNPDGTGASKITSSIMPLWDASVLLNNKYVVDDKTPAPDVTKRLVYTWNAAKSGVKGIRFGSDTMVRPSTATGPLAEFSALPINMQNDLSVIAGADAQQQFDLMMFLLGDVKNEQNHPSTNTANNEKYRQRGVYADTDNDGLVDAVNKGGILADAVNSSPIYLQDPVNSYDDIHYGVATKTYKTYKALQVNRPAMLYVGANDGMLHGYTVGAVTKNTKSFKAGDELFSYIPTLTASTSIYRGLHFLAMPEYDHLMYVDLTPTIRDVFVDLYSSIPLKTPEWRTMLIGGLAKGGKGYFALDVTCPVVDSSLIVPPGGSTAINNTCSDESFNEKNILWEFSNTDDVDMGYSFSRPIIAKVKYSTGLSASNDPLIDNGARWAVITGNGYNSANGRAALYIIFLNGGLDGTWTEGTDYIKIYASTAIADTSSNSNGLSSPTAVDLNNDGAVDRVYAGDLKGHLWAFDVSAATNNTQYAVPLLFPWKPTVLFQAGKDASTPQPITTPPVIQRDISKARVFPTTSPDIMVMFGTGQYLGVPDLTNMSLQTLYAVHDRGTYNLARYNSLPASSLKQLEPRIFTEKTVVTTAGTFINRELTGKALDKTQFGWYVDLASDKNGDGVISGSNELLGERMATDMIIFGKAVAVNSTIPVTGSCEGSTQSYSIFINWTEGASFTNGFYDANGDGKIDSQDSSFVGQFNPNGAGQITVAGNKLIAQKGRGSSGSGSEGRIDVQTDEYKGETVGYSERIGWEEKLPYGLKGQ